MLTQYVLDSHIMASILAGIAAGVATVNTALGIANQVYNIGKTAYNFLKSKPSGGGGGGRIVRGILKNKVNI